MIKVSAETFHNNAQFLAERSLWFTWDFPIDTTICIPFKDFKDTIILSGGHKDWANLKEFNCISQSNILVFFW